MCIGSFGQLQEWLIDFAEVEPGHCHVSHLWALHPETRFCQIKHLGRLKRVIKLCNVAKVAVEVIQAEVGHG